MANAHHARKSIHVTLVEHIPNQTIAFPQVNSVTFTGHNSSGILPPVLENRQRVIQVIANLAPSNHTHDATHT